jgi:SAM-dependent methyltransferase
MLKNLLLQILKKNSTSGPSSGTEPVLPHTAPTTDFPDFFQRHPLFLSSQTGVRGHRLEGRAHALIETNKDIIRGARILDLASHDGRWMCAALEAGASKVVGIEAREHLVERTHQYLTEYGISKDKYHVIQGDIFEQLPLVPRNSIDVVFCFGIFYHIMHHFLLLSLIKQLGAKYLILDSVLINDKHESIRLFEEDVKRDGSSIETVEGKDRALIGIPTTAAVTRMFKHLDFEYHFIDWDEFNFPSWKGLEDYRGKQRFSIVAKAIK